MKTRIAVLFPLFMGGGAEAVCAWILEALKEDYDVTLVTLSPHNIIDDMNLSYGTCLRHDQIKIITVPFRLPFAKRILYSHSAYSLRQFYLIRYYKKMLSCNYNLAFSSYNEMDFGKLGIQYIHLPMFARGCEMLKPVVGHQDSHFRRLYKEALRYWAKFSDHQMRMNITITNSQWMARHIHSLWKLQSEVIYPPVLMDFVDTPWTERENGFVLSARVVPEKRIEVAIEILTEIRKMGHDVHLHVLSGVREPAYFDQLQKMTAGYDWIFWEERLPRDEYTRMLATHKYGIHPRQNEQFGIGIAEMVVAGALPFVPAEGGQSEIVEEPLLLWQNKDEAVTKILDVLRQGDLQQILKDRMKKTADKWSVVRFKNDIRRIVANRLGKHPQNLNK